MSRATGAPAVGDDPFDAYYFANCCGRPYCRDDHWLAFFGRIAEHIATGIRPRLVLDAGCALGILVETLRARGIDAHGIDISPYAIANVHEPIRPFCRQGSIADELTGRYDLIVSIEVLEHLAPRDGEETIANFCRHTDDVLFSSTPSDHREPSHVNVQPSEYWAEQFARHGFYRDMDFDASFITAWAVRFRRGREPLPRIVRDYERRFAALEAARNDARAFAIDIQRDLARQRELGTSSGAVAGPAITQEQMLTHLSDLARALDDQRLALLTSRGHFEDERVAREAFARAGRDRDVAPSAARGRRDVRRAVRRFRRVVDDVARRRRAGHRVRHRRG